MNEEKENANNEEKEILEENTLDSDDIIIDEEEGDYSKIVKKLKDKLKVCETERQNYLEGWQRGRADYVNLKKEEERKLSELEPLIRQKIFLEIIPIADNFDIAFSNKESWEKVEKNWRIGIEGIYSNLLSTFSSMGIIQFGKEGERFNPEEYQAVGSVETKNKEEDDVVVSIVQKGYKYNNKVIRPCKVKVGVFKE